MKRKSPFKRGTVKNIPQPEETDKEEELLVAIEDEEDFFFFISLPFSPHGLYLPAESREENLTELVFVPQLLGGLDEARAGLRAVSYLQTQWKRAPLLQSRQLQLGF